MRSEDRSQQDVVFRAPGRTSGPVYHTDRDCDKLKQTPPIPVARDNIRDRWRECERCRHSWVPTLDDRAQTVVLPWVVGLWSLLLILSLFVASLGGVL